MLRFAIPTDLEPVFNIYMHPEVVPYLGYDPMPLDDFRPVFAELADGKTFFVWERDARVKGFCRATRYPGRAAHVAYLSTLAVSPDERGSGLAKQMIEAILARLQSQDVLRVELMVEADNPRAIAFYEKLGFQLEGIMRAAYKRSSDSHYIDEHLLGKLFVPLPGKGEHS